MNNRSTTVAESAMRVVLVLLLGAATVSITALSGCATTPEVVRQTDGPPPEGYETWEDYWRSMDRQSAKFEQDVRTHRMTRPNIPGSPR